MNYIYICHENTCTDMSYYNMRFALPFQGQQFHTTRKLKHTDTSLSLSFNSKIIYMNQIFKDICLHKLNKIIQRSLSIGV